MDKHTHTNHIHITHRQPVAFWEAEGLVANQGGKKQRFTFRRTSYRVMSFVFYVVYLHHHLHHHTKQSEDSHTNVITILQ